MPATSETKSHRGPSLSSHANRGVEARHGHSQSPLDGVRGAQERHAEFYLSHLERAERLREAGSYQRSRILLDEHWSNVVAAFEFVAARRAWSETAERLCSRAALCGGVLVERLAVDEQIAWFGAQLDAARSRGEARHEGLALNGLHNAYLARGDHRRVVEHASTCLALAVRTNDALLSGRAQLSLGVSWPLMGEVERGRAALRSALAVAAAESDDWLGGHAHMALGILELGRGDPEPAQRHLDVSLRISCTLESPLLECRVLPALALAHDGQGRAQRAMALCRAGLTALAPLGQTTLEARALLSLALVRIGSGQLDLSHADATRVVELATLCGDLVCEGRATLLLATLRMARGDVATARLHFDRALEIAAETGDRHLDGHTRWVLGQALARAGRVEEGLREMEVGVAFAEQIGHRTAKRNRATLEEMQRGRAG